MATTDELRMDDGRVFRVGQKLRRRIYGYTGTVTKIWVADTGPTGIRIHVDPDPHCLRVAEKYDVSWPVEGGGRYVECRDGGLSPRFWEEERTE